VIVLVAVALTVVALAGTAVVLADAPERQAVTLAVFGVTLVVLFVVLQAPDVALSELGVGTAVVPLMVMLAIRTMKKDEGERSRRDQSKGGDK
jgi:energy-converting hydrogenase B subunit D